MSRPERSRARHLPVEIASEPISDDGLREAIDSLVRAIEEGHDSRRARDVSVYTGTGGIVLMYRKLLDSPLMRHRHGT
jgi:hypothetical protein